MNEWGFASEVSKWWDDEFYRHPEWRLSACRVEQTVPEGTQRSDLFVIGGTPVMCGELRLPDHAMSDPWHPDNLDDAVGKALRHGTRWAFTSDSTRLLLIDTTLSGPLVARVKQTIDLLEFSSRRELDSQTFLDRVEESW